MWLSGPRYFGRGCFYVFNAEHYVTNATDIDLDNEL